jgi:hypothetical protein|tara:strand:- start:260 stop:490 length:231 start_codon:yes stop_codon:yes gene_type:complete
LGFFGLSPKNKPDIHKQIFQLIYYGEGFTHSDVYSMPIYLRNFYYKELLKTKKEESKKLKEAQQKSKPPMNPRFKR